MRRLLPVARVAERFHVLPSAAARAMDKDPTQLDIVCLEILHYSAAWNDYRSNSKDAMKAWGDDPAMALVQEIEYEKAAAGLGVELHPDEPPVDEAGKP